MSEGNEFLEPIPSYEEGRDIIEFDSSYFDDRVQRIDEYVIQYILFNYLVFSHKLEMKKKRRKQRFQTSIKLKQDFFHL